MKILVLAWEFPPRIVGGIARHVAELYPEMINLGHEIHLLTIEFGEAPAQEMVEGIHVYRVPVPPNEDFFAWVGQMNLSMGNKGGKLIQEMGDFDLIHAHDWLVSDAAIALKHLFKIPLIATIHATEYGRCHGLHNETNFYINDKEKELTHDAWRVIVCTQYMKAEVENILACPGDKIDIVYNGIRPHKKHKDPTFDYHSFRKKFAENAEKIVYYVGRIAPEKGIEVLLQAAPKVINAFGAGVRFIVIGGGYIQHLKDLADSMGILDCCQFTGFMPDEDLDRFQTIADCAVFPSLYEPFGIVVLESFAAKVPVVVSDVGGFCEVVQHQNTGIVTAANDPDSLAWGILEVLQNPERSRQWVENAYADLEKRFCWRTLARETEQICQQVVQERQHVEW
ncbi:MAG: glycosyltransferase family 4 protein [Prochlorotrichaceae cyanobacterium]|jgi:glycosyltransferase involved in cell wall biosynthesis